MPRMSNEMLKKIWEFRHEIILESTSKSDLKNNDTILKTINQTLLAQAMYRDNMSSSGAMVKKLPHNHI